MVPSLPRASDARTLAHKRLRMHGIQQSARVVSDCLEARQGSQLRDVLIPTDRLEFLVRG